MIEMMGTLIRYIVILIFWSALLEMILPQGVFRRYLRVIVGILLIFTILSPIQNFMKITPHWEVPAAWAGGMGEDTIFEVFQKGEEIQEENVSLALTEYRHNLQEIISSKIIKDFALDVVELEIDIEEDPQSMYFGVINQLSILLEPSDTKEMDTEKEPFSVPLVTIDLSKDKNKQLEPEIKENSTTFRDIEEDISTYLAAFLGLPGRDISVIIRESGDDNG